MFSNYINVTSESMRFSTKHKSYYEVDKSISLSCHIALIGNNKESKNFTVLHVEETERLLDVAAKQRRTKRKRKETNQIIRLTMLTEQKEKHSTYRAAFDKSKQTRIGMTLKYDAAK